MEILFYIRFNFKSNNHENELFISKPVQIYQRRDFYNLIFNYGYCNHNTLSF